MEDIEIEKCPWRSICIVPGGIDKQTGKLIQLTIEEMGSRPNQLCFCGFELAHTIQYCPKGRRLSENAEESMGGTEGVGTCSQPSARLQQRGDRNESV